MQTPSPLAFYYFSLIMACKSLILENSTHNCVNMKSKPAFIKLMFHWVSEGSAIAWPIIDSGCVCTVPKQGKETRKIHPKCENVLKKEEQTLAYIECSHKAHMLETLLPIYMQLL